jgi:hypothetical protein
MLRTLQIFGPNAAAGFMVLCNQVVLPAPMGYWP